jgi:hypothetical protein
MTDGGRRRDSKYRSAARHRAAWHLRIGAGVATPIGTLSY